MRKLVLLCVVGFFSFVSFGQDIKPEEVKKDMKRVADWQIDHFNHSYSKDKPHHPLDWTNGALYVGMVEWAKIAEDEKYFEWLKGIGERNDWKLHKRKYHADDHTVGQMYCELYRKYGEKKMIVPTIEQFEYIMYHPAKTSFKWVGNKYYKHDRWSWCDALFMSPPVWAKLYNINDDERFLDFMFEEYKATTDFLFDEEESLYYRDESYMGKLDNGTKIFWGRGNGWVFAGLANILAELDPKSKEYKYFLDIYKKMAKRLLELQTDKGHWAMSLLGDEFYPTPETSGSSFFVFGLAWGINNGILDADKYKDAVFKGWKAMSSYVTDEGMLGYVQPIGAAPGNAWPDKTEVYGTGAFLSAGSEVYKLVGGK